MGLSQYPTLYILPWWLSRKQKFFKKTKIFISCHYTIKKLSKTNENIYGVVTLLYLAYFCTQNVSYAFLFVREVQNMVRGLDLII
jgi:adenosine deaminase